MPATQNYIPCMVHIYKIHSINMEPNAHKVHLVSPQHIFYEYLTNAKIYADISHFRKCTVVSISCCLAHAIWDSPPTSSLCFLPLSFITKTPVELQENACL